MVWTVSKIPLMILYERLSHDINGMEFGAKWEDIPSNLVPVTNIQPRHVTIHETFNIFEADCKMYVHFTLGAIILKSYQEKNLKLCDIGKKGVQFFVLIPL